LGSGLQLMVETSHPQPAQVRIRLQAPSGQQAELILAEGKEQGKGRFVFSFADHFSLANLATKEMSGNWTLAIADLQWGASGELIDWSIGSADGSGFAPRTSMPQPIPEPRSSVNAMTRLGPGGRLAVSWPTDIETQGSLLVWDLTLDDVVASLPRSRDFKDVRFLMDGERIVVINNRQLIVYETATGKVLGEVPLTASGELRFSENGRYLALDITRPNQTAGIAVWDLDGLHRSGQIITAENAGPVSVDSAGKYLAIGGRDPWVRIWSLADGALAQEFEHSSALRSVNFDPTGNWLATDDLSNTFRVWNVQKGGAPVIERFGISEWFADFATNGNSLMFGSSDRAFRVAALPGGQGNLIRMLHARHSDANPASSSGPIMLASHDLALTSDAERTVKVWSVPTQPIPGPIRSNRFSAGTRAVLSADGKRIAVGTSLGDVRIHAADSPGGMLLQPDNTDETMVRQSEVISLAFSANRSMLASSSINGRVRVWDAENGTERDYNIAHPDGGAHDLLFIDNDKYLVSASRREILVTDVQSGEVSARLRIQANHPQLAIARQTGDLFIADDQNGVTVWNWQDDDSSRIVGSDYRIRNLAVTDDSMRMVTAGDDGELILWDLAELTPLANRMQAAGKVDDLWIAPDGQLVVQAGYWLQAVHLSPRGLSVRSTRLLSEAPASVMRGSKKDTAMILLASPSRPLVNEILISEPPVNTIEGDLEEFRQYWRDRLAITLDELGNTQPIPGQSLSVTPLGAAVMEQVN
ncbi:MAG: proprotein convertase P-domain-containing protein, partial [Gammaproteobacteria bacterium]